MLIYEYNRCLLDMEERPDEDGVEFQIKFHAGALYTEGLKKVEQYFERNRDYTDVLFYKYPAGQYRVLVRTDYYESFVIELFKARLLLKLEWTEEAASTTKERR